MSASVLVRFRWESIWIDLQGLGCVNGVLEKKATWGRVFEHRLVEIFDLGDNDFGVSRDTPRVHAVYQRLQFGLFLNFDD